MARGPSRGGKRIIMHVEGNGGEIKIPSIKKYNFKTTENKGTIFTVDLSGRPTRVLLELIHNYYFKNRWLYKENFCEFLKKLMDEAYPIGLVDKDMINDLLSFLVDREYISQLGIIGESVDYFVKDKIWTKKKRLKKWEKKIQEESNNGRSKE